MINVMNSMKNPLNEGERCLDPQLWHACAGGMVQMPSLNSEVVYFPQGHAEHANKSVDFGNFPKIPPLIPCRVSLIKYLADMETDEVYAKISLNPLKGNEYGGEDDGKMLGFDKNEGQEKPNSFAKTLTQSDANNGGGFSVPRYCAETIFPRLDYSAEPPVQTILVKDVHGGIWKFRHIYRGTPRRHLLTTGWSNFVNQKKLVAGDSIVFLRAEIGDLCIGIRRAKRGIGGGTDTVSGWNPGGGHFPASSLYQSFLAEEGVRNVKEIGKVRAESVIEAATLAANGRSFEVVYYPRASTPEFVVKASAVRAAMRVQWCSGMRFKMPFETEDSSRISWFMGTISSVQVDNPIHWPNSPWRLLQVAWDEPDLLQNVKRVSPWLVELVSNMPAIHLSPFTPPRKKLRVPQPPDFPFGQFLSNPISPNGQLCYGYSDNNNNIPAGIQGARHAQFGFPSSEFHLNKLQAGLFPFGTFNRIPEPSKGNPENISCLLTIGNSNIHQEKIKKPAFVLFGTTILTEQQIAQSCTVDTVKKSLTRSPANLSDGSGSTVLQNGPSDDEVLWNKHSSSEIGQCKLFLDSEDFGRAIDLTALRSYEELYRKLADMIRLERSDILSNIVYQDIASAVRQIGDQPFSEFVKTARKLTIVADSSSNNVGR